MITNEGLVLNTHTGKVKLNGEMDVKDFLRGVDKIKNFIGKTPYMKDLKQERAGPAEDPRLHDEHCMT